MSRLALIHSAFHPRRPSWLCSIYGHQAPCSLFSRTSLFHVHIHTHTRTQEQLQHSDSSILIPISIAMNWNNTYTLPLPFSSNQPQNQYQPRPNQFTQLPPYGDIVRGFGGVGNWRTSQDFPNGVTLRNVYQPSRDSYSFSSTSNAANNIATGAPFPGWGFRENGPNTDAAMRALYPPGMPGIFPR